MPAVLSLCVTLSLVAQQMTLRALSVPGSQVMEVRMLELNLRE